MRVDLVARPNRSRLREEGSGTDLSSYTHQQLDELFLAKMNILDRAMGETLRHALGDATRALHDLFAGNLQQLGEALRQLLLVPTGGGENARQVWRLRHLSRGLVRQ